MESESQNAKSLHPSIPTAVSKDQRKREYLHNYYLEHKQERYPAAPPELIEHLRVHPAHALGKFLEDEVCADCERYAVRLAVCLECGRTGFGMLSNHLIFSHKMSPDQYRTKYGYNRSTGLASAACRERVSKQFSTPTHRIFLKTVRPHPPRQRGRSWELRTEANGFAVEFERFIGQIEPISWFLNQRVIARQVEPF